MALLKVSFLCTVFLHKCPRLRDWTHIFMISEEGEKEMKEPCFRLSYFCLEISSPLLAFYWPEQIERWIQGSPCCKFATSPTDLTATWFPFQATFLLCPSKAKDLYAWSQPGSHPHTPELCSQGVESIHSTSMYLSNLHHQHTSAWAPLPKLLSIS